MINISKKNVLTAIAEDMAYTGEAYPFYVVSPLLSDFRNGDTYIVRKGYKTLPTLKDVRELILKEREEYAEISDGDKFSAEHNPHLITIDFAELINDFIESVTRKNGGKEQ